MLSELMLVDKQLRSQGYTQLINIIKKDQKCLHLTSESVR